MADRNILYRLRAALQGGFVGVSGEIEVENTNIGLISGVNNVETALSRIDGTGIGAMIFRFTGAYSAQASNISEWFGGTQISRLRCTDNGGVNPVTFDLPGTTALNTAFDTLVTAGLPETLTFIIEYTGPSNAFVSIRPRVAPSPQIQGITNIIVRSGVAATLEITRNSGTISDYVFTAIGGIGDTAGGTLDAIKLINPTNDVWDASASGPLPSSGVVKGNAYKVVNAPSDGTGRFGEVMQDGDWVVWEGETFTSWSAVPLQWFVIPGHDVRRITALEEDYLADIEESPVSDRNTVIRGADYADTAGELRFKIYTAQSGAGSYDAADLNTTGVIDNYTNVANITGTLAIRLDNASANQDPPLTDLFVYVENSDGTFVLLGNMARDFAFRGDFGGEADYTSIDTVQYTTGQTIRIYLGTTEERYGNPNLDVTFDNLSEDLKRRINNNSGQGPDEEARIASLETKVDNLFPLTPDVSDLVTIADVIDTAQTVEEVVTTDGYSLMVDYRGDSTRYEQAGITYDNSGASVVRYTGFSDDLHRAFGFKVTAPANQTLLWLVDASGNVPIVDMTSAGNFRVNNYLRSTQPGDVVTNEVHFLSRSAGDEILRPSEVNLSTFTITNFPAGATGTSRFLQFGTDVFVNGADTQGEHLVQFQLPTANTAQARTTVDASVFLGPLYNSRTVNITLSYTLRVSGLNLLVDVRLVSAPSDVTIRIKDVVTTLNYTAAATTTRTDRWVTLTDLNGDFTFAGEAELLLHAQPIGDGNTLEWVPVVRLADGTVDQLNDGTTVLPHITFDSVEIPDSIDFRSFLPNTWLRHSELAALVARTNTQWVYGLAELRAVGVLQINEQVTFPQGIILVAPDSSRHRLTVGNDGSLKTEVVV